MTSFVDDEGRTTPVRLLAPLRLREFRLLWTGMGLFLLGDDVLLVARSWQAYALPNRPPAKSLVGVALTLPQAALLLVAGVLSDRVERSIGNHVYETDSSSRSARARRSASVM